MCSPASSSLPPLDPAFVPYRRAASYLKSRLLEASIPIPKVGIICGSGLSNLSDALDDAHPILSVPYGSIPGFPSHCTVPGHKGELVFGLLNGLPTACLRGRFHSYEGHDMRTVALPVRVLRCLGTQIALVTNAAGGLNKNYSVGDVVCITDHVAVPLLAGRNPLVGPNDDALGPRFPPTSDAYDPSLPAVAMDAAASLGYNFVRPSGTYAFVSGPQYESKAECRFLRDLGGDAVGMSTVPEIVAAHHAGMKVLCLSLITNKVIISGDEGPAASHGEVLDAVNQRSGQMVGLVAEIVKRLKLTLDGMENLPPIDLDYAEETAVKNTAVNFSALLCPHHVLKAIVCAPAHCMAMGAAMVAIGAFLGATASKRR